MKRVMAGFIVLLFLFSASNEANAALSIGCNYFDPPRFFNETSSATFSNSLPLNAGERLAIQATYTGQINIDIIQFPVSQSYVNVVTGWNTPSTYTFTVPPLPQNANYQLRITFASSAPTVEFSIGCEAAPAAPPEAPVPAMFTDGRINPHPGAPVAMWCQEDDGLVVYGIDANSQGYLSLYAPPDLIASVPAFPDANTLIATGANGVRLYRLSTGELQVNAPASDGKEYVYLWNDCAPDSGVRYYILGG
jgi:hypothetical protein